MFLHQAVLNTGENLSSTDASEQGQTCTIEVHGQKGDKNATVEIQEESVETVIVEDNDESVETLTVEDNEKSVETVTLEDFMNFFENDLSIDSDRNFMNIGKIVPKNCRKNSQSSLKKTEGKLRRSTRKSRN